MDGGRGAWCKVVNVPGRGLTKIKQVLTMWEGSSIFNHFQYLMVSANHIQCLYELPFWSPVDMRHDRYKMKLDLT